MSRMSDSAAMKSRPNSMSTRWAARTTTNWSNRLPMTTGTSWPNISARSKKNRNRLWSRLYKPSTTTRAILNQKPRNSTRSWQISISLKRRRISSANTQRNSSDHHGLIIHRYPTHVSITYQRIIPHINYHGKHILVTTPLSPTSLCVRAVSVTKMFCSFYWSFFYFSIR